MSNNDARLFRDFADDVDDHDKMVHVRQTPHGTFRAVVERDIYADAPDNDFGCPVYAFDRRGGVDDTVQCGEMSARHDGMRHTIGEVWERMAELPTPGWTDTIDHVDRYLRIFHGGSAKIISSTIHQGDDYIAYDTRAMRESWGQTGDMLETSAPDATEWQAFIDGDVYIVSVEKGRDFDEDGEPLDWESVGDGPIGGHYGDDWAAQAALDMLDETIDDTAADMLPLGE